MAHRILHQQSAHHLLLALAMVIETKDKKIALCSVDHLGFTYDMVQEVIYFLSFLLFEAAFAGSPASFIHSSKVHRHFIGNESSLIEVSSAAFNLAR